MAGPLMPQEQLEEIMANYGLSERAAQNMSHFLPWDMLEETRKSLRSPSNPDGVQVLISVLLLSNNVFLGVAENPLLYDDVVEFIKENLYLNPDEQFGYGVGPRGAPRLKMALASFFKSNFHAKKPVLEKEMLILPGVGGVTDALVWAICNEGEALIIPVPFWSGISQGVGERACGRLVPATYESLEGYKDADDLFDPEMNRKALENALDRAAKDNIKVRGVMLCNPHNPLGRCYPAETLKEIARFCGKHDLHLVCDEVFAMSTYENPDFPAAVPFISALSLNFEDEMNPHKVHVAYGMGKDFCIGGFRCGVLHSRNEGLITAVSTISVLQWVPYIVQDIWASMLLDDKMRVGFMEKNHRLLAEHSSILTTFLKKHDIPFYAKINAGMFAWVNLQRYIYDKSLQEYKPDFSATELFRSNYKLYRDRELKLWERLLASGVGLGLGTWYSSEEPGWFRISFTVAKDDLHIGLERLVKVLGEVEAEGWT
ncbi:hypothetical protein QQS21_007184 [Conoideocrella luteorostrata]|uniref:Aminotransferase class I/classII large domain-containing protein n=1 Tax=Conoideocrella luteorostrata TaxID=1105319 RepID=A0AAJ0CNY2_9HYPO|nr:hypothetical protein QQS21_007184 [Conoideocrella luteorostrata]